jgi:multiple sugar transport system substrate-binding protein
MSGAAGTTLGAPGPRGTRQGHGGPLSRRRLLLGLTAGGASAGAVALSACLPGDPAQTPLAPQAAAGKVEFWYGLNADGVQPFVDDFAREFPAVSLGFTPTADHANKLYTASAAGAAPNVATGWPGMLWTIEPAVQLLDSVIKGDRDLKRDNYWPGYWDFHKFKGQLGMLPMQANNRLVFYDKAVLDENGLPEPKTWEDFRRATRRLTRQDGAGPAGVSRWGYQCEPAVAGLRATVGPWANRNGFVAWNREVTRSGWGEGPMLEAVEFLLSLIHEDGSMTNPLDNPVPGGVQGGMPKGLAAMVSAGPPAGLGFIQQLPRLEQDLQGFLHLPGPRARESYLIGGGQDLILFKTAQGPDQRAALELMRYLGFTRNVEYCKLNRTVYPAVRAAANDPYFSGGIWKAMWTNWNEAKVPPHPTGVPVPESDEAINPILSAIFRKERNPREGLQEIGRQLDAAAAQRRSEVEAFLKAGG